MAGENQEPPPAAPTPPSDAPVASIESRMGQVAGEAPGQPPSPQPAPTSPAGGGGGDQQATAAEWQSIRDYAKQRGVELPWEDDNQAVDNLLGSYRQLQERNYYADLGRQIAPHAEGVRNYLQQQQQAVAQPAAPAYRPPPFRKEWLGMVETDPETGVLRSKAGYDPSLPEKVQAYADWRDKFLQEPDTVLGPMVEERARQMIQQEMGQHREQTLAQSLIQREATWLFQGGSVGGQLTPAGRMYGQVANHLYAQGLRDVQTLHQAAVAFVQNAYLRSRQQAQPTPPTPAAAAEAPISLGGALTRPGSSSPRKPPSAGDMRGMSLRERLNKRFDTAGVPDNVGF